ncbi:DEAD/DEAH box helicase family protein [Clostridium sp.]|uniref:DEAD/DEAH box helicase family protein n=1 Tax=Clostridium sp. TaxID=1506 RepID=UPI002FC7935C
MKKLYLSEVIKNEGIMLQRNKVNIIVAPAGSGKTHYIFNELLNPQEKSIYLCDTSNLKEAILRDDNYIDYVNCRQEEGLQHGFNIPKYNTTVMTYAEYGFHHEKYSDVKNIICDEIHNLYKYKDRFCNEDGNGNYDKVIEVLFDKAKNNINVVGFTATHRRLKGEMDFLLPKNDSSIISAYNSNWNVINMSNHKEINRLESDFTFFYNNYRNLGHYLKAYNGFKYGKKQYYIQIG